VLGSVDTQTPHGSAQVNNIYNGLGSFVKQLSTAADEGVTFTENSYAKLSCSDGGCIVTSTVTGRASSTSSNTKVTGGSVTAQLVATVAVDGISAGGCENASTLPLNTTSTISCDDGAAGAEVASETAKKKAQAQAESEAEGGAQVEYTVDCTGEALVTALATIQVAVLVQEVQQEQQNADDSPDPYSIDTTEPSPDDGSTPSSQTSTEPSPSASPTEQPSSSPSASSQESSSASASAAESASTETSPSSDTVTTPYGTVYPNSLNPYEPVNPTTYSSVTTDPVTTAPTQNPAPAPAQPNQTAASPQPTEDENLCESIRPANADIRGDSWVRYTPGRSQIALNNDACFTGDVISNVNAPNEPYEYETAVRKLASDRHLSYTDARAMLQKCHLIGAQFGGRNDTVNIVPCFKRVNNPSMESYENTVIKHVPSGKQEGLLYRVMAVYKNAKSDIPSGFVMSAYVISATGKLGWSDINTVANAYDFTGSSPGWYNLGN
jgi:hypothetical protein